MNIYYVYAYLRKKDYTPYYIGKGKGIRAYQKHNGIGIPKNKQYIVFLETNLTELGAYALERRMIRWYGRKDLGTGILLNRTDGGEGGRGDKWTEDHKKKYAESRIGKSTKLKGQPSPKKGIKIGPASEEHKAKNSAARLGIKRPDVSEKLKGRKRGPLSEEQRLKASLALKGRKWFTNGVESYFVKDCPEGCVPGRGKLQKTGNYSKRIIQ